MATPHIGAEKGAFAKTVIMPGDPLRAKMIAEKYLDDAKLVTEVRGMLGYTGTYQGKEISVMGSGMGVPSIGIYSYELFTEFDVDNIIRVGTCGSYVEDLDVGDVVLVDSAWSESTYAQVMNGCMEEILYPNPELLERILAVVEAQGKKVKQVRAHTSDVFYRLGDKNYFKEIVQSKGCEVCEMESFALFHNANATGKKAGTLLTVSDSFVKPGIMTAEERQNTLTNMLEIALATIL